LLSPLHFPAHRCTPLALRAIFSKADDIENLIGAEAEEVGCNYEDEAAERRHAARAAGLLPLIDEGGQP